MTGLKPVAYTPDPAAQATYDRLYALYRDLHDSFGGLRLVDLAPLMKALLALKQEAAARRAEAHPRGMTA